MSIFADPLSGVLTSFFNRALENKVWDRFTLAIELSVAGAVSFLVGCGSTWMLSPSIVLRGIGIGMILAGVAMFGTVQVSDHAKGLKIAFTQQVADEKLENPTTTIARDK